MARISLYRSLLIPAAAAAALAWRACGAMGHQETLKVQQLEPVEPARGCAIIYQLAEQQYKVGDYEKCNETLKEAFATKAQFAPMYTLQAKVQIEQGNLELAGENLNASIRHQRRRRRAVLSAGRALPAVAEARGGVRLLQGRVFPEARRGALSAGVGGDADLAEPSGRSQVRGGGQAGLFRAKQRAVHVALARIAILQNDFTAASSYYREAVTLMPDDPTLRRSYAEALFYSGQYAKAVPMLEEMRKQHDVTDKANLLMMLGQSYMGLHRYPDARNTFQEVIRDNPDDMLAYLNLGKACVQTGDLGLSLAAGRQVLRSEPENIAGDDLLALVQQKQKKWADAGRRRLKRPTSSGPRRTTVLCMLGISAQQLGKKAEAVAFYEKAVEANPKDMWAAQLLEQVRPASSQVVPAEPAEKTDGPAAANAPADAPPTSSTPSSTELSAAPKSPEQWPVASCRWSVGERSFSDHWPLNTLRLQLTSCP